MVPGIGSGEIRGAKRWIYVGFNLQPSEVAKLAIIIFLSARKLFLPFLEKPQDYITIIDNLLIVQTNYLFSGENKIWFYLVTYYLHSSGYEIKEFPRILARPPVDP